MEAERISVDHVAHLKPSDGGSAATQCKDSSFKPLKAKPEGCPSPWSSVFLTMLPKVIFLDRIILMDALYSGCSSYRNTQCHQDAQ